MPITTIKVPVELRDRLAEVAQRECTTLAKVIARLLDAAEERQFWDAVSRAHQALSEEERAQYVPDATLSDNLTDANDDQLSAEDRW